MLIDPTTGLRRDAPRSNPLIRVRLEPWLVTSQLVGNGSSSWLMKRHDPETWVGCLTAAELEAEKGRCWDAREEELWKRAEEEYALQFEEDFKAAYGSVSESLRPSREQFAQEYGNSVIAVFNRMHRREPKIWKSVTVVEENLPSERELYVRDLREASVNVPGYSNGDASLDGEAIAAAAARATVQALVELGIVKAPTTKKGKADEAA